jgi:hypothetical protein
VLAFTSLLMSAWLLFGAAAIDPARMAGMFGWAVFGVIGASIMRRSSAVSTMFVAAVVAGWCAIAAYGNVFTEKPHPTAPFIVAGPALMGVALLPFVARMKVLTRTVVVAMLGLLVGAAALGYTAKRYADEQAAAERPAAASPSAGPDYGAYR